MQEPCGDEEPDGQAANYETGDKLGDKKVAKREDRGEQRGESKWLMQNRLREGRRTAWSRWDILGEKIHLPQEEIDRRDRSLQKPFRRRTARATRLWHAGA